MLLQMSLSKILADRRLWYVLQKYQNFTVQRMICTVAFGVGLKCPRKIHFNTQCPPTPRLSDLSKSGGDMAPPVPTGLHRITKQIKVRV